MKAAAADRYYQAASWWHRLREANNETFLPLFFDEHRYLVLKGGAGSGKSIFAGRKVLERVTSEPGHRWLVCRKVAKTLRESCFNQLIGQLTYHRIDPETGEDISEPWYPGIDYQINRSDLRISFSNNSEILFVGLDDVEKLKSIYNITGVWIEEPTELTEKDFNQLDIRLRGKTAYYKQIILSFNPVSLLHWLKKRFWDRQDKRALTHSSTYKDNRFLTQEDIETLEAFRDVDPYYYMVYACGEWGVTGKSVFNAELVTKQLLKNIRPKRIGYFAYDVAEDQVHIRNIRWVDDEKNGFIRIYEQADKKRPYVIGGDTAGEGSDRFVGQVIDNITGRQMAVLRRQFDEDLYTRQMYCLGRYYNNALIGIEANYSTYPLQMLDKMGYKNQYVREVPDDYTGKLKNAFGFRTDTKTRPVIIAKLVGFARDYIGTIVDRDTLEEMLTFVRNEEFRAEAEEGAHDDTVMALAIAHHIREQGDFTVKGETKRKAKWTEDMWEDYRHASTEEKELLLSKWGNPF